MNKLSRYFLSLMTAGTAYTAPIQANAEEKETAPRLEEKSEQKTEFDLDKIKIEAVYEEDKEVARELLQELSTTPKGKRLLNEMPQDITFECKDYYSGVSGAGYDYDKKAIYIYQDTIEGYQKGEMSKAGLADLLGHEILHSIQDKTGRLNKGIKKDGIEGYSDFTTRKLSEVETLLYHVENATNQPEKYKEDENLQDLVKYFETLKSEIKSRPENRNKPSEKIKRIAKSNFVKTLWESNENHTNGPEFMKEWSTQYNMQAMRCMEDDPIGKRDIEKENRMIQQHIDEMGIDIPLSYFRDIKNCHLSDNMQTQIDERERKTQMLDNQKKGLSAKLATCSTPLKTQQQENVAELPHIPNAITKDVSSVKNNIQSFSFKIPSRNEGR